MEPYETFCKQPIEECCYPEDDVWKQYFSVPWVLFWDSINTSLWHSLGDNAVKIWTGIVDLSRNSGLKNMETNCDCQSNAGWLIRNKQLDKWSVWTCLNNTYHFWSFPLLVLNVTWHDCPGVQLNSELLVGEGEIKRPCKGNFKILKNPVLIIF